MQYVIKDVTYCQNIVAEMIWNVKDDEYVNWKVC